MCIRDRHNGTLYEQKKDDDSGTNTGRLSAKNPAVQTIPKHTRWAKALRRCYPAPPGMRFWEIDFSQGELRVAACCADERNMIDLYLRGFDLHAGTGATLAGVPVEVFDTWKSEDHAKHAAWKDYRQRAKAGNFGLLYRMSARGFQDYAWKQYSVAMSLAEAEAFKDGFFDSYPGLIDWHERQVRLAKRDKFVRSPLGRVRHLPLIDSPDSETRHKAERNAINSPVQATLSDLCIWSAHQLELATDLTDERVFHCVGSTHDALYGYARESDAVERVREAARIMASLPLRDTFGWDHQLDFPVEAELGENWGDMRELSLAAQAA